MQFFYYFIGVAWYKSILRATTFNWIEFRGQLDILFGTWLRSLNSVRIPSFAAKRRTNSSCEWAIHGQFHAASTLITIHFDWLQAHNAQQLSNWCLHFIATNYSIFESSPFFSLVQGTNKEYVEEQRWPPLSYINEIQEYEKKIGNSSKDSKCSVM